MRISKVKGIIAISENNVIGQGDLIPWHHSGDLRHFKSITMGHGVLIGYPTFVGIAKRYIKQGAQVFPGRIVFVVGREPFDVPLDIDTSNIIMLPTYGPKDDIETSLGYLKPDQHLFIAGGARVYRDYLSFAEQIYLTLMKITCLKDENTISLPVSEDLNEICPTFNLSWRSIIQTGTEACDGIKANYFTLDAMI